MESQHFEGLIEKSGAKTVVMLPFDPNDVWGVREKHYIRGTVDGHIYRGPLGSAGGKNFLSLGSAWLRDSGLAVGATVAVELFPEGPQSDRLAQDIQAALNDAPQAKSFFDALATFYRKGYLRWIDGAKRPETRAARIAEMVTLLQAGKKQRN